MHRVNKDAFHRKWKRELRKLAAELDLESSYNVRSNRGGVAVLGEVTLHSPSLYLQVGGTFWDSGLPTGEVLYRSCKSVKDYTGGVNRWTTLGRLETRDPSLLDELRRVAAEGRRS